MPTTLLQITPDHEVVVLEMGMWAPGEIRFLANLAWPYIGIVTNVGPSHLERVKSIDVVEQAKSELPDSLPPDGIAILNIDDERVARMARRTLARVFSYGLNPSADVWADQVESHGLQGITFDAHHANETVRIKTPLLGKHSVYTALAGIAIGLVMGMNWDDIIAGLQDENSVARIVQRPGLHGSTIIDDTYNAAPVSAIAALGLLAELDGRRIAALGDMLELGAIEEEAHRSVGRRAAAVVQELICVGQRARWIADEAQVAGMTPEHIKVVDTNNDVVDALQTMLRPGDYVLVKGSRGAAMESIVAAVQRHPEE